MKEQEESVSVTSVPEAPTKPSSSDSSPSTKAGAEPIELLLELASYNLQELADRKVLVIQEGANMNGEPIVVIVISNAKWQDGIVLV